MRSWPDVLDALDAAATILEAVAAGAEQVEALPDMSFLWDRPHEPLPAELAGQAMAVFERLRTAEETLRSRRSALLRELEAVAGSAPAPAARYVDTTA